MRDANLSARFLISISPSASKRADDLRRKAGSSFRHLGEQSYFARRGRALQGGRHARGVPAARAHLLLDDRELAQAGRRGRPDGAGAPPAGAEAGWLGTTHPAVGARRRSSAPQARARRIDHRCPKKTLCCTGPADDGRPHRGRVMLAVAELAPHVGLKSACQAFALNRGFVYRDRNRHDVIAARRASRARPPLALSAADHGSIRTMHRLLAARSQTGERRRQRVHPPYAKPELLAVRPNEVWSWDITKLKGPAKWTSFHLYVILDVFSRYAVAWSVQHRENAALAKALIAQAAE